MALSKPARRTLKALGGSIAVIAIVTFLGALVGLDLTFFAGWFASAAFRDISRPRIDDLIPPRRPE